MNYRNWLIFFLAVLLSSCLVGSPTYFHSLNASSSDEEDRDSGEGGTTTSQPVVWNRFNYPDASLTIQYPSNWIPTRIPNSPNPIDMDFSYYGADNDFAGLVIQKFTDSPYFNSRDALQADSQFYQSNVTDYPIERPIECTKYKISGFISACSMTDSWQEEDGRLRSLVISAVDESTGEEYHFSFTSSSNLFEHFLPVADHMIKSFKVMA